MNEDFILKKFFEADRWEYAINKGVLKDMPERDLIRLTRKDIRISLMRAIISGEYEIAPPHTANIPKDTPGEFRTVYINEPIDRISLSIANDLLFDLTKEEMIHKNCLSYLRGVGCGNIVKSISSHIAKQSNNIIGFKSDLSKYFDSVPIEYIDKAFDDVEAKYGHSSVIDFIRKYYHNDIYFDLDGNIECKYQSLKQGCSVASWLADVILYDIDKKMSSRKGLYLRYCDDAIYIGDDHEEALEEFRTELEKMKLTLNPKKVQTLKKDEWFKFLGFTLRGDKRSLGKTRIKNFQKEIEARTINKRGKSVKEYVNSINSFLYKGNGEFSWSTQVLPVINVDHDLNELNKFVMDAIRAAVTKKTKIGGLGFLVAGKNGCIDRGKGRNVKKNREKIPIIQGYMTMKCMQNAILTSKAAYRSLVSNM